MMRILKVFSFSVIFSLIVSFGARAATSAVGASLSAEKAKPPSRDLLKCLYTPQADSQSSSLPTMGLGFKFYLEPKNNNEIGVDIYSLGSDSQPMKQVGHAEMTATQVSSDEKSLPNISAGLVLAEDSPFEFAITLPATATDVSANSRFSAMVDFVTTFDGASYSQLAVQCRKAP